MNLNNRMKLKYFFLVLFLGTFATSYAQYDVVGVENNVHFSMPEAGIIGPKNESSFEWSGKTLKVHLYFSKRGFDLDDADQAAIRAGKEVGVSKTIREKKIETETMKGVYFQGERNGSTILFASLLNPKLKRGIFVDIEFEGDLNSVLPILHTFEIKK